jgi:hypothetical protein
MSGLWRKAGLREKLHGSGHAFADERKGAGFELWAQGHHIVRTGISLQTVSTKLALLRIEATLNPKACNLTGTKTNRIKGMQSNRNKN